MEKWKNIKGYEGIYKISNLGNVKALSKKVRYTHAVTDEEHFRVTKEKILKTTINKINGYAYVTLRSDKVKTFSVHRLVAMYFVENKQNKPQVNHIDGNKINNAFYNLEWCTEKENMKHASNNNLMSKGDNHYKSFISDDDVKKIRKSNK